MTRPPSKVAAQPFHPPIDPPNLTHYQSNSMDYNEITIDYIANVLDLTIKHDKANKVITFLCMLSAYTEDSQFNISFNAPSSAGKTHIATEVAKLFPDEDTRIIGHASPTAIFHRTKSQKADEDHVVDLERKIIVFLDQSSWNTLEKLRAVLSHDKKEIKYSYTDRTQKSGLRTVEAVIRGFPSVVNCTAGVTVDEQESTRFLLLSPETSAEKIRSGVDQTINKEADSVAFNKTVENNPERIRLKHMIQTVKGFRCTSIKVNDIDLLRRGFYREKDQLLLRHQRDIKWVIAIIKSLALLNFSRRNPEGTVITANKDDIRIGIDLWDQVSESQKLGVTPMALAILHGDIEPLWDERRNNSAEIGLTRSEIIAHHSLHGESGVTRRLLGDILPALEMAGLIEQRQSDEDRRNFLIYPPSGEFVSTTNKDLPDQGV